MRHHGFHRKFFASLLLSLLLTSCSSAEDATPGISPSPSVLLASDNDQLVAIQSDNVQAAGFNANAMVMTVQFDNGDIYEYYGVPLELWNDFLAAQPHPWSQVGYPRLVKGGFAYKRVS